MDSIPQFFMQWFPHAVITKPGVCRYQNICFWKLSCDVTKHVNRLFMFTSELNLSTVVLGATYLNTLFEMIVTVTQRQARPAAFDYFEQPN